ncbi:hypothetical protein BGX31_001938 [Mortierella sp. GBA43]|nr:hypothetical protein BGX31_001938 [Mortierella sp. GBA43]
MLEACESLGVAGDQASGFQVGKALPKGMISLDVTDGIRKMRAVVIEPIPGIAMEMKLGAKIRIRDVDVRHGVLQLDPSNTLFLGGEVASMNRHPRRLVIMNQMKKRLGLPQDNLPDTSTLIDDPLATPHITTMTATAFRNNISANSSTPNHAQGNIWSNPQTMVNAQDTGSSTNVDKDTSNPWRSVQPFQSAVLPPRSPPQSSSSGRQRYEENDVYLQQEWEYEPQWDYNDIDLDDIPFPDDDANWESMSQLSVDTTEKQQMQNPIGSSDFTRDKSSGSPATVDVDSFLQEAPSTRRKFNLRAPLPRQQKLQHEEPKASVPQTDIHQVYDKISKQNTDDSDELTDKRRFTLQKILDVGNRSSPIHDGISNKKAVKRNTRSESPLWTSNGEDDSGYNGYMDSGSDLGQIGTPSIAPDKVKRRVSPEQDEDEDDFATNRRRSRSFPKMGLMKSSTFRTDPTSDDEQLVKVKAEKPDATTDIPEKDWGQDHSTAMGMDTGHDIFPVRIKSEVMDAKRPGISALPLVIDLLSDDDEDVFNKQLKISSSQQDDYRKDLLRKPISKTQVTAKSAIGSILHLQGPGQNYEDGSEEEKNIDNEKTLMEFDTDDEGGSDGLSEVVHRVPEVELDEVVEALLARREVKAIARIHKLGKFMLTNVGVSLPIFLRPVSRSHTVTTSQPLEDSILEAVLDSNVALKLIGLTYPEFAHLSTHDKPEAMRVSSNS